MYSAVNSACFFTFAICNHKFRNCIQTKITSTGIISSLAAPTNPHDFDVLINEVAVNFGEEGFIEIFTLNKLPPFNYYSIMVLEGSHKYVNRVTNIKRTKIIARFVIEKTQIRNNKYVTIGRPPNCEGKCLETNDENMMHAVSGQTHEWLNIGSHKLKVIILMRSNNNFLLSTPNSDVKTLWLEEDPQLLQNVQDSMIDSIIIRSGFPCSFILRFSLSCPEVIIRKSSIVKLGACLAVKCSL